MRARQANGSAWPTHPNSGAEEAKAASTSHGRDSRGAAKGDDWARPASRTTLVPDRLDDGGIVLDHLLHAQHANSAVGRRTTVAAAAIRPQRLPEEAPFDGHDHCSELGREGQHTAIVAEDSSHIAPLCARKDKDWGAVSPVCVAQQVALREGLIASSEAVEVVDELREVTHREARRDVR
eukprot:scaffold10540_cov116-Isochrysis_galbana.AAC.13